MKSIVIAVGVVMIMYVLLEVKYNMDVAVVNTDPVVEVQTVEVLEERIKEAQETAKVEIETRAKEAYDALYKKEMKKVEDSIKAEYIAEIEATITDSAYWLTDNRVEKLIRKYFPENSQVAIAVAKAESGLNPQATNWNDSHQGCNGSFGIFQIGCLHESDPNKLYDVEYNIKRAREIYDQSNSWQAWGAFTDSRYKQYLAKL